MGRRKTVPVVGIGDFWDALMADYGVAGSYAWAVEEIEVALKRRLDFFDEFNRTGDDTDVWTSGGDGSTFIVLEGASAPTAWQIITGGVIDNDSYIHGFGVIGNKVFTPHEDGYSTVTWEARLSMLSVADISAFLGLIGTVITDYAEPATRCAHFLADTAISATYRARSYQAAEQETDTLVALDAAYHVFKIVWTAASVLFYIDDVLVATHATQVPLTRMTSELLMRTEAAAAKRIYVDYVRVEVT